MGSRGQIFTRRQYRLSWPTRKVLQRSTCFSADPRPRTVTDCTSWKRSWKPRRTKCKYNNDKAFYFSLDVALVYIFYMIFTSTFRLHKWKSKNDRMQKLGLEGADLCYNQRNLSSRSCKSMKYIMVSISFLYKSCCKRFLRLKYSPKAIPPIYI